MQATLLDAPGPTRVSETETILTRSERRTLGAVLGFLAGLAALGPIAAVAVAVLGAVGATVTETR